ncbi:MAG TPA: helix-turn-helix transcriptional regulator [Iamia sp.]|nr:helix-turn-helix transcriptional regulator [Iamia sp.]
MPTWEPIWPPAPAGSTTLAGRIASLRGQRGWTQQQLADRLGISRVAVSHLEAGINSPDSRTVALLAGLFHLEAHDLVGGTDYPAAKADRLPLVVTRHTEVEHQLALMEVDLAWVEGPDAVVADHRVAEAVRQRWRTTLAKLAGTVVDPAETAELERARRRLAIDAAS